MAKRVTAADKTGTDVFGSLARLVVRWRWLVVVVWLVAVPLAVHNLPSMSNIAESGNSQFLPSSSPSLQAAALGAPFRGADTAATAIVVASSAPARLKPADNAAIDSARQRIARLPGVSMARDLGVSRDGQAREILVGVSAAGYGPQSQNMVASIRSVLKSAATSGLALHLSGQFAEMVDQHASSDASRNNTQIYSLLFIVLLLLVVYRSLLAPLITLLPAGLSLLLAQPLIAEAARAGLQVSPITQLLLIVLILGAGTDYGIFLVFRVREELRRGLEPQAAVVQALSRVGVSITFSALTVAAALLSLMLASFGIYRSLGPALAIGLGVMLLAALTLLPALLAIFGRAAFWPSRVNGGEEVIGFWGAMADKVIRRPVLTMVFGSLLFVGLSLGVIGYRTTGFADNGAAPAGTDSAQGAQVIAAHFSNSIANPDYLYLRFDKPVWDNLAAVQRAQASLAAAPVFRSVSGPFDVLSPAQLATLHRTMPPPGTLPLSPPPGSRLPVGVYQAYRAEAQHISPDGRTVQFGAALAAGPGGSTAAMRAIPAARDALDAVARQAGASQNGVYGTDAIAYDVSHIATSDLERIVPVVLVIIGILLAVMLRSLVAPLYLIVTVGLSYLAALGFAMIVFVHIGGSQGLNFILPFLMFIFSMALGEDYNILVMSRIREESQKHADLKTAVTRAIGSTGSAITSAGLILAGTFSVLALAGGGGNNAEQIRQIGYGIAFGVLLDTLFVRSLLVPSLVVLLGRWNWWPSGLSRRRA